MLGAELELGILNDNGSQNHVIPRTIGLQFVGRWETVHLRPFEDRYKLYLAIVGILIEYQGSTNLIWRHTSTLDDFTKSFYICYDELRELIRCHCFRRVMRLLQYRV